MPYSVYTVISINISTACERHKIIINVMLATIVIAMLFPAVDMMHDAKLDYGYYRGCMGLS